MSRRASRAPWLATLVAAWCLAGPARAQTLTAVLSPGSTAYAGEKVTLTFLVTYTNGARDAPALHEVDVSFPSGYTLAAGSGPSGDWTFAASGATARFLASCRGAGLAPGATAAFQVTVTVRSSADDTSDTLTASGMSPYTPVGGATSYCDSGRVWWVGSNVSFPVHVLRLSGVASPGALLGAGLSSTVIWTVQNTGTQAKAVTFSRSPGAAAGAGWTERCSGDFTSATIAAGASRTVTCTCVFSAAGTYAFTASAAPAWSTSQTAAVSIEVGAATAAWDHGRVVIGRPSTLTVTNASATAITRLEVRNARAGGLAIAAGSATNGLAYAPASSDAATAVFTGSLAAGASAMISLTYSAASVATSSATDFTLAMTPADGTGHALSRTAAGVPLTVPLPDVSGLGILSNATGQRLDWSNVSANGSTHDGVVVLRAAAGSTPATPVDFQRYAAGVDPGVVFAESGGSTAQAFEEPGAGSYAYRVCQHDAAFVYSTCSTGYWNGAGWLDSAVPPAGGWTRQLGLSALDLVGMFPGGRAAIASNQPSLSVVALDDGQRVAAPVALTAMPSVNTAGVQLADGRTLAFAADAQGTVVAVDTATGALAWTATLAGETFTGGVTGITRSAAAAAFQAAYPGNLLLLGSSATGDLLALDAATGATLWSLATRASIYAPVTYDPATNVVYVPTAAGILAYDLGSSSPTTAPRALATWTNPGGTYTVQCVRTAAAGYLACVDRIGVLRVLAKATGQVQAQLATSVKSPGPSSLLRMSAGTPGFAIGSAARVVRVAADAAFTTLTVAGEWLPGLTLSPLLGFSASGYLLTAANDQRLHKLSSETAAPLGQSDAVPSRDATTLLGAPSYDATNRRFVFGTAEGRIWAVPVF